MLLLLQDSLSAKADLRKGDVIKSVNKTAVKGMPVDDVSYLLSNAASAVNFVVLRKKGEPAKRKKSLDKAPETPKKKKSTKEGKKKSKKSKKKKSKKGKEEKKEVEVPREKTLQEKKDDEEEVFGFGAAEDPVPVVVEAPKPVDEGRVRAALSSCTWRVAVVFAAPPTSILPGPAAAPPATRRATIPLHCRARWAARAALWGVWFSWSSRRDTFWLTIRGGLLLRFFIARLSCRRHGWQQ